MPTGHLCSDAVLTTLTTPPAPFLHEWNQHLPHCPNQKVCSHPPSTHTPWHCSPPIFNLWVLWILLPKSLYTLPPPQVGPPSILDYFHSHSRWPCLPLWPPPTLQWKHQVLPLCTHCSFSSQRLLILQVSNHLFQEDHRARFRCPCYVFPIKELTTWYCHFLCNVCIALQDMSVWLIILAPEARTVSIKTFTNFWMNK